MFILTSRSYNQDDGVLSNFLGVFSNMESLETYIKEHWDENIQNLIVVTFPNRQ